MAGSRIAADEFMVTGGAEGRPPLSPEDVMPTNDEIFQKVQATLVDALGVDEEDD